MFEPGDPHDLLAGFPLVDQLGPNDRLLAALTMAVSILAKDTEDTILMRAVMKEFCEWFEDRHFYVPGRDS